MKISGCVIAKNEETNIANCINNLKSITDEIIVVDTGSEDNTVKIAKELGAIVYEFKWEDDFSKARNVALEHATGDWIVFLDSDEYFDETSISKVRMVIEKAHNDKNVEGIQCQLVNIDTANMSIISIYDTLRVFRNHKKIRFINKIHEEIRNNGKALKCTNVREELSVIHTGYTSTILPGKIKRNLDMLLRNKEEEKSSYYLATTYYALKDYKNAYYYADQALSEFGVSSTDHLAYKMHLLRIAITLDTDFNNKEKIRKLIDEANEKYGSHPEIARIEAVYLYKLKNFEKALEKYIYALECQEKYGKTLAQNAFEGNILDVYKSIAELLYLMNKDADALSYYVKILKINKYHIDAFNRIIQLCGSISENDTIAFINSIYDSNSEGDVRFIVSHVPKCGRPKIILYYVNKWNNGFGHEDDTLISAFTSQKSYSQALEIALLYLKSDRETYSPLVVAIIIMGRLFSEAPNIQDRIDADYLEIISCYEEERKFQGNKKSYLSVLSILVRYFDQFDVTDYLKICREGDTGLLQDIAGVFLAAFRFEQAIDYFKMFFEMHNSKYLKALAAFKLGFCYYKLKQNQESLEWLDKAIMNGYTGNEIAEYLRWIASQSDKAVRSRAVTLIETFDSLSESATKKLHIGCGRDIKEGWINLDLIDLPGVDVVANLDTCRTIPLPFGDDSIDEILASHVIEHINDPLPMMQELHRIAKPNAKAVFRCPYGTSDDAYEDPTHVKQYFLHSFGYFSQPFYWRADYGYRGDWCVDKIILVVQNKKFEGKNASEILDDILTYRNTVTEMIVELHAEKPAREPKRELIIEPIIEIQLL